MKRHAALGAIPANGRKAPRDGGDGIRLHAPFGGSGGACGNVEAGDLRIRGEGRKVLPPAPGGEMLPIGGVGAAGVGGTGGLDIGAGAISELFEMRRHTGDWHRGGRPSAAQRRLRAPSWLRVPWIDHRCACVAKVADISGDNDQIVDDRGCGNQPVDVAARSDSSDAAPFDGDLVSHGQDAVTMVVAQLTQPLGKVRRSLRVRLLHEGNTAHDLTMLVRRDGFF